MPVFYYHPQSRIPQELAGKYEKRGWIYQSRGELELTLQRQILELGYDILPTCHTVMGTMPGSIEYHLTLNPDDELDQHSLKLCKNKSPWSWIKVLNGRDMMFVIGYTSSSAASPFAMGTVQQAQMGITGATMIPRAV